MEIKFQLPEEAEIIGWLNDDKTYQEDPRLLDEDILQIHIGDLTIDVGWYPRYGSSLASFKVYVFMGDWDDEEFQRTAIELNTSREVENLINVLIKCYNAGK